MKLEKTYTHEVTYDFDGQASISEVAASLLANERLIKEAIGVIKSCHDGLTVSELRINLAEVSQNSPLKEVIAVTVLLAFQEDLEEEVPNFIQDITGIAVSDKYDTMVTVVFVAVVLWGGLSLIEKVFKSHKKTSAAPNTESAYQNITHVAGNLLQVSPEFLRDKIDETLGGDKKRTVRKLSRDFLRPAKTHNARSIKTSADISIPANVISEFPSVIDEAIFEPKTDIHIVERIRIQLRAHDLDSDKAGWAGVIGEISEERVKVHLEPTLSPQSLFNKASVLAQVRVYTKENDDGVMKPYLYVIQEVLD